MYKTKCINSWKWSYTLKIKTCLLYRSFFFLAQNRKSFQAIVDIISISDLNIMMYGRKTEIYILKGTKTEIDNKTLLANFRCSKMSRDLRKYAKYIKYDVHPRLSTVITQWYSSKLTLKLSLKLSITWWRHDIETLSSLLALWVHGPPPPVTQTS